MNDIRIISVVDPEIEASARDKASVSDLVVLLKDMITTRDFKVFKHLILMPIPASLTSYANYDERLKSLLIELSYDRESNILIVPDGKIKCKDRPITDGLATEEVIAHSLKRNRIPLLVGTRKGDFHYDGCHGKCARSYCADGIDLQVTKFDGGRISKAIQETSKLNIDLKPVDRNNISPENLKSLAFLMAVFLDITTTELEKIENIEIAGECCNDLKAEEELENVAFTMLRAHAFPSTTDRTSQQCEFSIDWHPHTIPKIVVDSEKFSLFRCDVLPPKSTGKKSSGPKRLFFTRHNGKSVFFAYSPNHTDPSPILLRKRIGSLFDRRK